MSNVETKSKKEVGIKFPFPSDAVAVKPKWQYDFIRKDISVDEKFNLLLDRQAAKSKSDDAQYFVNFTAGGHKLTTTSGEVLCAMKSAGVKTSVEDTLFIIVNGQLKVYLG